MQKTCSSCKYHGNYKNYPYDCDCQKFVDEDFSSGLPSDGLLLVSYEYGGAGFRTGDDFGCIHWAHRE